MGTLPRHGLWPMVVCLVVVVAAAGCGGDGGERGLPADAAATVGDRTIAEAAVDRYLRAMNVPAGADPTSFGPPRHTACVAARRTAGVGGGEREIRRQCRIEYEIQRAQAVSMLVRAQWLDREGARRRIDVRRALEQAGRQTSSGETVTLRVATLTDKLTKLMPVTRTEIERYGRDNAQVYHGAEQRRAHVLQTTSKRKADRARRELRAGAGWAAVQGRYGVRPFERHWTGTKTVSARNRPEDDFGDRLFAARPRQLIGPLRTLNGWFLFELIGVREARYPGLSPRAHQHVAAAIRAKKLERALQARYADQTECAPRYRVPESPQCVDAPAS